MSQILSNLTSDAILLFLPYGLLQISPIYLAVLNTSLEATLNPFQYKTDC